MTTTGSKTFAIGDRHYPARDIDITTPTPDIAGLIQKYSLNVSGPVDVDVNLLQLWDKQRKLRDFSISEFAEIFKLSGFTRTHSILVVEGDNAISHSILVVDGNHRIAALKRILEDVKIKQDVKDRLKTVPCIVLSNKTPVADLLQIGINTNSTNEVTTSQTLIMQAELLRSIKQTPELANKYIQELIDQGVKQWWKETAFISDRCASYILHKHSFVKSTAANAGSYQNMFSGYCHLTDLVQLEQHQSSGTPAFSFNMFNKSFIRYVLSEDRHINRKKKSKHNRKDKASEGSEEEEISEEDREKNDDHPQTELEKFIHKTSLACFTMIFSLTEEYRLNKNTMWDAFFHGKRKVPKYVDDPDKQFLVHDDINAICSPYLIAIIVATGLENAEIKTHEVYQNMKPSVKNDIIRDINMTDRYPEWMHQPYPGNDLNLQESFVIKMINEKSCREIASVPKEISPRKPSVVAKIAKEARKRSVPPDVEERRKEAEMTEELKKKQRPNLIAGQTNKPSHEPSPGPIPGTGTAVDVHEQQQKIIDEIIEEEQNHPLPEVYTWTTTKPREVINGEHSSTDTDIVDEQLVEGNITVVDCIVDDDKDVPDQASTFFTAIQKAMLVIGYVPSGPSGTNTDVPLTRSAIDNYTKSFKSCISPSGTVVIVAGADIDNISTWNQSMIATGFVPTPYRWKIDLSHESFKSMEQPASSNWALSSPHTFDIAQPYILSTHTSIPYLNHMIPEAVMRANRNLYSISNTLRDFELGYEYFGKTQLLPLGSIETFILKYTRPYDIVVDYFGRGGAISLAAGLMNRQGVSFEHNRNGSTDETRNVVLENFAPLVKDKNLPRNKQIVRAMNIKSEVKYLWTEHLKEQQSIRSIETFLQQPSNEQLNAGTTTQEIVRKTTDMAMTIADYFGSDYLAMIAEEHAECQSGPIYNGLKKNMRRRVIQDLEGKTLDPVALSEMFQKMLSHYTSDPIPIKITTTVVKLKSSNISSSKRSK